MKTKISIALITIMCSLSADDYRTYQCYSGADYVKGTPYEALSDTDFCGNIRPKLNWVGNIFGSGAGDYTESEQTMADRCSQACKTKNLPNDKVSLALDDGIKFTASQSNNIWQINTSVQAPYCTSQKAHPATLQNAQNKTEYDDLLLKYAPIFYLHKNESAYPIAAEEYFTAPKSSVKNWKKNDAVVIPAGSVTFAALYALQDTYHFTNQGTGLYVDVADCTKRGSNPAIYTQNGALKTPAYAIAFENNDAIYLQYLLLFGFNDPYSPGTPFFNLDFSDFLTKIAALTGKERAKKVKTKLNNIYNLHAADLEHITLEVDKNSKQLKRIYYSSHGRREGVWLPITHQAVQLENTHPIAYLAKGGHGVYPMIDKNSGGVYLRIYGMANDQIGKDVRWEPDLVRIYTKEDKNFDAATMGWLYFPGDFGRKSVSAPYNQAWFANSVDLLKNGDIGRSFAEFEKTFCPRKNNNDYDLSCFLSKVKNATVPD